MHGFICMCLIEFNCILIFSKAISSLLILYLIKQSKRLFCLNDIVSGVDCRLTGIFETYIAENNFLFELKKDAFCALSKGGLISSQHSNQNFSPLWREFMIVDAVLTNFTSHKWDLEPAAFRVGWQLRKVCTREEGPLIIYFFLMKFIYNE